MKTYTVKELAQMDGEELERLCDKLGLPTNGMDNALRRRLSLFYKTRARMEKIVDKAPLTKAELQATVYKIIRANQDKSKKQILNLITEGVPKGTTLMQISEALLELADR